MEVSHTVFRDMGIASLMHVVHPQKLRKLTMNAERLYINSINYHERLLTRACVSELEWSIHHHAGGLVWLENYATQMTDLHCTLQECSEGMGSVLLGESCHGQIVQIGLQACVLISNMLIKMYSKCGYVGCARRLFDKMPERSLVSWNTMIASYTQNCNVEESFGIFRLMQREAMCFNGFTISSILCTCAKKCLVIEGKQLHALSLRAGIYANVYVGTALLDVYAKCNLISEAHYIFDKMPERSSVTWSSMVAGCVQNEYYDEALALFQRAHALGLEHNKFTVSSILCACAVLAASTDGNQIHGVLHKIGLNSDVFVASSMIDMLSRCGIIEDAYVAFSGIDGRNVVSWNVMIASFSRHAHSLEAMILFEKMQQMGFYPNEVTYLSILSACSHMGLVARGRRYFDLMRVEHGISPNVVHYSCMVDIFGRAGLLHEAMEMINTMPFKAIASMWGSLLASCRTHKNLDLAKIAAEKLFEIEPQNAGNHVLLSNIYAANKRWAEVATARKMLNQSEAKKERGKSWVEFKGKVHIFMVGERNHSRISEIYLKLGSLVEEMKKFGYSCHSEHDLHDVDVDRKQELLMHHSEKLAFVFCLMVLPSGTPIRILKNLRICGDCHSFMKLASNMTQRRIIVRDTNRFHHFDNGLCSCGDFW